MTLTEAELDAVIAALEVALDCQKVPRCSDSMASRRAQVTWALLERCRTLRALERERARAECV